MDTSARPGPATDSCVEITAPSVDAAALQLLETDPAAYFEQTRRPLPLGLPVAAIRRLASAMDTPADSSDTTDSPSDSVDPPHQSEPRFKSARARRRHEDRKLVPVAVGKTLGVSVAALAEQMRSAGLTERLNPARVNEWVAQPAAAPQWFAPALQRARARDAARIAAAARKPKQSSSQKRVQSVTRQKSQEDEYLEQFLHELRRVQGGPMRTRRRGRSS